MPARIAHPAKIAPGTMEALHALGAAVASGGVPTGTLKLVHLRVSEINGCSVCLDEHNRIAKRAGETDQRLSTLAAWQDAPYFTDAERAAVALGEPVTRLSDHDETALAVLVLAIANINVWNRLNVATRQPAGVSAP